MNNQTKKHEVEDAFSDLMQSVMDADWDFLRDVVEFTMSDLERDLNCDMLKHFSSRSYVEPATRHALQFLHNKLDKNYAAIDKVIAFQNEHRVPDGDDNA